MRGDFEREILETIPRGRFQAFLFAFHVQCRRRSGNVGSGTDVDVHQVATLAEIVHALAMPETLPPLPHDATMLQPGEAQMLHDFAEMKVTDTDSKVEIGGRDT